MIPLQAVVSLDGEHVNVEKIQNMQLLLPKPEEIQRLKQVRCGQHENLGQAELFFLSVMKVDRFEKKLAAFKFFLQFNEAAESLRSPLGLLAKACDQVVQNKKLASLLRRLLAVGNIMNESAGKPKAAGITLDSLIKTAQKKGSDGTTVLDHLVTTSMSNNLDFIDFWEGMPAVVGALRLDLGDLRCLLQEARNNLQSVERSVEAEKTKANQLDGSSISEASEKFIHTLVSFLQRATVEVENINTFFGEVERKVQSLCSFFAEDHNTCKVCSIVCVVWCPFYMKETTHNYSFCKGKHNIWSVTRFLSPRKQVQRSVSQENRIYKAKRIHCKEQRKGQTQSVI